MNDGGPPVRAVFVSSARPWLWGGGEKWMVGVAAALRARGHEITLAARPGSRLLLAAQRAGVPAAAIGFRSDLDPITFLALRRLFKRVDAQVVVVTFDKEVRLAGLAARSLPGRMRVVCRKGLPLMADNWRYRWSYAHLVDGILTPAHSIRRRLGEFPWLKVGIEVVTNGVDLAAFPHRPECVPLDLPGLPPPGRGQLVVELARLSGQKGHVVLLEAASALRDRFPEARYLLVGDGAERAVIESERRRRGLERTVLLAGHRDDPAAVLAAADVVVLPSLHEGYPNVLLEAMAIGRPVVASAVGDSPDIVVEGVTGFLVPPGKSGPLADRLALLLGDPQLRARLGAAARDRAEREFSAERMIVAVEDYLRRQVECGRVIG